MTEDIIDRLKEFMERPGFHAKDDLLLVCDAIAEIERLRNAEAVERAITWGERVPHNFDDPACMKPEGTPMIDGYVRPEGVPVSERSYEE